MVVENADISEHIDPTRSHPLTFLVVGCQRCGTTWIDTALREHPEIYLPSQKQTYFFDQNFERGLDWYLANFADVPSDSLAVGEVATGYSLLEAVPRVAEAFPDIRIAMCVRNPVDRAYSYVLSRQAARGWKSFAEALEAEPEILDRGQYIEQIEALLQHYPRERLLLLFFDDLKSDDRSFLRSLLSFLGVDPDREVSALGQQVNSAMYPRIRRIVRRVGLKRALTRVSRSRFGETIRRRQRMSRSRGYKPMPADVRSRLEKHYMPFNNRLAEFAGRDLSHWTKSTAAGHATDD